MLHKKLLRPLTCDRSSPLRSAHVPGHPGAPFKATARVCEEVQESHASADVGVWPFLQDAQASRAPGIRAASARPAWACGGAAPAERPCAARRWLLLAHHLRGCAQGECGRCGNGGRGGDPSPGQVGSRGVTHAPLAGNALLPAAWGAGEGEAPPLPHLSWACPVPPGIGLQVIYCWQSPGELGAGPL